MGAFNTIEIDGVEYHADLDGVSPLRDEYERLIEATVCICAAHSATECVCGTWWDDDEEEEYD